MIPPKETVKQPQRKRRPCVCGHGRTFTAWRVYDGQTKNSLVAVWRVGAKTTRKHELHIAVPASDDE
jgi:hypothetical protein